MASAKEMKSVLFGPIFANNPIALQILGICSALAVTSKMSNTLVMCIALTAVVAFSNFYLDYPKPHPFERTYHRSDDHHREFGYRG